MLAAMTILCLSQSGCARNQVASIADLTVGFLSPPESAKPLTWWHWMNGNVTREGITLDLEKMKDVGVAGFQIFDVGQGIPQGPVDYLSPEWLEMMQWAAQEADRLGLEYDMHNCPGWSSTGGPWVTPEWAMQNLVWSETTVIGGTLVDVNLAQPYTNLDYYRDAFVLAFPAPGTDTQPVRATSSRGPVDLGLLAGGDPGGIEIRPMDETDPERPGYLQLEYAAPIDVRTITLGGVSLTQPGAGGRGAPGAGRGEFGAADQMRLEVSDDGVTFRSVTTIIGVGGRGRLGGVTARPSTTSFPVVTARYFRLVIPRATRITELRLSSAATISDWQTKSNAAGGRRGGAAPAPEAAETGAPGIDPGSIVDISRYTDGGGRLKWQAPAGNWTVIRFGHTPTGTQNRAGSSTGTGLEIDKYSRDAVDFHWNINIKPVLSAMAPIARKGLAGIVVDSYEAGLQNWTAGFPEEFQKRCGYDLRAYMPAMTGKIVGNMDISERFLWDVRRTMADLMVDNYYAYIAELAHKNRLKFYVEPYHTAMFDETQVGYTADVVMGEFWQGQGLHASIKLVSSVGHVGGIRVVGAESFTSRSRWTEYPYSLKVLGDWMYTMGLNRYIFHRHAMQPHPDAVPGMTMGPWGGHFDRTNTWWNQNAAAWLKYVARCQYLLQQGLFVGDLLYYTGEDAPLSVESGRDRLGVPRGYDYDVAGKEAILHRLRVRDGRIILPDGMSYRLLVLPEKRTMTVEVARRLRELEITNFSAYHYLVRNASSSGGGEFPRLIDELTTNETYFFRERGQLRALMSEILPELRLRRAERGGAPISIWSAGCSSGEEPYTIVILALEAGLVPGVDVRVYASDISQSMLRRARQGVYREVSFREMEPSLREKYFVEKEGLWRISDSVKEHVDFIHLNLLDRSKIALLGAMDVILCRNVIIYFDVESKRRVIQTFFEKLRPGGHLLLGHSESLINLSSAFELRHLRNDLVYRRPLPGVLVDDPWHTAAEAAIKRVDDKGFER